MNMWRISYLLETVLGSEGFTIDDVYIKAQRIIAMINLIAKYQDKHLSVQAPPLQTHITLRQIIRKCHQLSDILYRVQERAGMFSPVIPAASLGEDITPNDIINELGVILAELISLNMHLGIDVYIQKVTPVKGKTPSEVYQLLEQASTLLSNLLGEKPFISEGCGS